MKLILSLLFFSYCFAARSSLLSESLKRDLQFVGKFYDALNSPYLHTYDMTVGCALCGVAINEIEGLLSENITETEIVQALQKDLCAPLGGDAALVCDVLVDAVPFIIDSIENPNSISTICIDLTLCSIPFPDGHPDPVALTQFTVNLDNPPEQRWTEVCSNPTFKQNGQFLYNTISSILPDGGKELETLGENLNLYYYPEDYSAEIIGCAVAMEIPFGWAALFQLGYEVSDACTSIVAQDLDGTIWHARNLDFGIGMGFTETLKENACQINFIKNGKTLFTATTFAGYIGVLSGMKPNAFSVTIDTRFYPQGFTQLFYEIIAAIEERNASLVAFLSRRTLEVEDDWNSALASLSNVELIADVYYIIAGVSPNQGAVISRNRTDAADVWILDNPSRWFEVETNYDHWNPPPWFDNRRDPANEHMNQLGQSGLSASALLGILSQKPTLNLQTTYSIIAHPASGTYQSYARYCTYPCVQ